MSDLSNQEHHEQVYHGSQPCQDEQQGTSHVAELGHPEDQQQSTHPRGTKWYKSDT